MDTRTKPLVTVVLCLLISSLGAADTCTKVPGTSCKCSTPSGLVVDLNLLNGGPNPRFTTTDQVIPMNTYVFTPCKPLKDDLCNSKISGNIAFCQKIGSGTAFDVGDLGSEQFAGDPEAGTLTVTYTGTLSPPPARKTQITLICSSESDLKFVREYPHDSGHYFFELRTPVACPVKPDSGSSGGLSVGSVLVILFFVFFLIYWIGGFIFMKFVRRAEGLEAIPNYEFWKGMPSLIRDGFAFTARGCKGESTYEKI